MKKIVFLGLVLLLVASSTGFSQNIPLPKEIVIKAPSPELPKEIAAFSGKWKGTWVQGGAPMADFIIVVTEIDLEKAEIIYACAEAPMWMWGVSSSCTYETAKVTSGQKFQMQFQGDPDRFTSGYSGSRPWYTFEMQKDLKTLKGTKEYPQWTWKATLEKIE